MDVSKTGVYVIENLVNGKKYVGSAARSFRERWNGHKNDLKNKRHHSHILQRAFNKYGEENFKFDILGYYPPCFVLKAEQHFIDTLKPEYNICKVAGSLLGTKRSETTKQKMSSIKKELHSDPSYGKRSSERLKKYYSDPKNRQANSERQKKIYSCPEKRERLRQASLKYALSEEGREAKRLRGIAQFSSQEAREKNRQEALRYYSEHPEAKEQARLRGKKQFETADAKEAQRQRAIKQFSSEEARQAQRDLNCKFIYEIKTPSGEIEYSMSIKEYAKNNNLVCSALAYTLIGFNKRGQKVNHHKGYKVLSKTPRKK